MLFSFLGMSDFWSKSEFAWQVAVRRVHLMHAAMWPPRGWLNLILRLWFIPLIFHTSTGCQVLGRRPAAQCCLFPWRSLQLSCAAIHATNVCSFVAWCGERLRYTIHFLHFNVFDRERKTLFSNERSKQRKAFRMLQVSLSHSLSLSSNALETSQCRQSTSSLQLTVVLSILNSVVVAVVVVVQPASSFTSGSARSLEK